MSRINKPKKELQVKLKEVQKKLFENLVLHDEFSQTDRIAGVDQAFPSDCVCSGLVVLDEALRPLERKCAYSQLEFPYIPGLLAFREIPPILKVWKKVEKNPDILLVDGHGIAHPRKLGLASHVGLALEVPTIGVAKNVLVGDYEEPLEVGEAVDLRLGGEAVGKVLKSKKDCNPIFVSPGHRVSVETSLEIVKVSLKNHKLPEPLHKAHRLANKCKEKWQDET